MPEHSAGVWLGFTALVATLLILDLGVLNRRSHVLSMREAGAWSGTLVLIAGLFGAFLWQREGAQTAIEFYTGYLVELSLSVDNLFVFILIFQYFAVPPALQPRVLKWGILGAIVMRAIMIALGTVLLTKFHWIIYVFGAILIATGVRMLRAGDEKIEPERNPLVRLARRFLPMSPTYEGQAFLVRPAGKLLFTPLFLVLLVVEWSDVVFAIDSIPAIFAITRDPFIVYSSNVFAIVGLRALFFVLAGAMNAFAYLKPGVAAILVFVGTKMTLAAWFHIPALVSLAVILLTLTVAIVASIWKNRRAPTPA
ncbi:MAG: TerC family protein [Gemmatimonadales bacterium]|nr:TerC family protein [Gemmatimonadales bacterium]